MTRPERKETGKEISEKNKIKDRKESKRKKRDKGEKERKKAL